MSLSVRRWTQRRLLYPLAIFAIIAPTVVLALFGVYALRETVLQPADYREFLHLARDQIDEAVEKRLSQISEIPPPADPADVARAQAAVERYFTNEYARAMAQRAYFGVPGRVEPGVDVQGNRGLAVPPELEDKLGSIRPQPDVEGVERELLTLDAQAEGRLIHRTYALYIQRETGGFIAWEVSKFETNNTAEEALRGYLLKSGDDTLKLDLVDRATFRAGVSRTADLDIKGYVVANDKFLRDRNLVLSLDTGAQFTKNDQFLSNVYILIAVLCVPIVASATLMVVHMILREASEARKKVDFVSNVTHELKTPLTSIRMFVETLKLGRVKDPEKVQACLDTIMNETQRLGALIDHVLSFSKVENQVKKYNIENNDLAQVVIDTINLFKAQAPKLRERVQRRILAGLPSSAMFDKDAVREVLLNLLTNAVKYSPGEKPIVVTAGAGEKELFVAVQDQGIGIDPQFHERIFEKFFRVDEDLARNVDGTGLGLAIVAEIVKAHGGRITVDSALGRGSTFTVFLPWKHGQTVSRRKTTRMAGSPPSEVLEPVPEPEAKPVSDRQPVNARLLLLLPAALLAGTSVLAQPEPDGNDPAGEPAKKEEASTLQERPESDAAAEGWVKKLGGLRPRPVSVQAGVITGHTLSPDGDRLYYYRPLSDPSAPKRDLKLPATAVAAPPRRFALHVAGPDKPEAKLLDTGCACEPPLFLPDGRLVLVQRLSDTNDDGEVSALDDGVLVACNRDGGAVRRITGLEQGAAPVGIWRDGAEVLVAQAGLDDPNGWILSVNLVKGTSERVVQAFTVALVMENNKLLIERLVAPPPPPANPNMRWNPFGMGQDAPPEQALPTLLDHPEHLVFDPADGSVAPLYGAGVHSRIVCQGEGSYFGHQLPRPEVDIYNRPTSNKPQISEILVIDDAQHRDTRTSTARYHHYALGWVKERGLLVLQTTNLRSRVMLLDRALKWHTLGELDLAARGVRVTPDGLKLCWLEVEDTDENGSLEPWNDHSRPFFAALE